MSWYFVTRYLLYTLKPQSRIKAVDKYRLQSDHSYADGYSDGPHPEQALQNKWKITYKNSAKFQVLL